MNLTPSVLKQQIDSANADLKGIHARMHTIRGTIARQLSAMTRVRPCDYEAWQAQAKKAHQLTKLIRRLTKRRDTVLVKVWNAKMPKQLTGSTIHKAKPRPDRAKAQKEAEKYATACRKILPPDDCRRCKSVGWWNCVKHKNAKGRTP